MSLLEFQLKVFCLLNAKQQPTEGFMAKDQKHEKN
jgi:hypothetical protein